MTARVVRADGQLMGKVSLNSPLMTGVAPRDTSHELLTVLVKSLELGRLPDAVAVPLASALLSDIPPPLVTIDSEGRVGDASPLRLTIGFSLIGVGATTLAVGGALFGVATASRRSLTPDASGAVPADQAKRAGTVTRQSQVATALIPAGAALTVTGLLLTLWPGHTSSHVALAADDHGATVSVRGALP